MPIVYSKGWVICLELTIILPWKTWSLHCLNPISPPLSKVEGLRDIGHSINIGNLILGVNSVTVSYLIHDDGLLQNAIEIYYKMRQVFITKCDSCYKLRRFYYKVRQLLQDSAFIKNCDSALINNFWLNRNKNLTELLFLVTNSDVSIFKPMQTFCDRGSELQN